MTVYIGALGGFNTAGSSNGDVAWLGSNGAILLNSPGSGLRQPIGSVINVDAVQGGILFDPTDENELFTFLFDRAFV